MKKTEFFLHVKMPYHRRTLGYCQNFAEKRGGKCLSTEYINPDIMMKWKCSAGHVWEQTFNNVRRTKYCYECHSTSRLKTSIETCKEYAEKQGGKCLSTKYINHRLPLKWECAIGHKWEQGWKNIYRSSFCKMCTNDMPPDYVPPDNILPVKIPISLAECQDVAFSKGGLCTSDAYINSRADMEWECKLGHKWQASASKVCRKRKWCESCENGHTEVSYTKVEEVVDKDKTVDKVVDIDKK